MHLKITETSRIYEYVCLLSDLTAVHNSIIITHYFDRLINCIEGTQLTFSYSFIEQKHRYESLKLSFVLEKYGNVCVDVLPRIAKPKLKFRVIVNVERYEEEIKKDLEKCINAFFSELFDEKAHQLMRNIESEKISCLFFLLYGSLVLHING